jgi:N12 class adenine-specific DNA methylase
MACGRVLRAVRAILAKDSEGARRLLRIAYDAYKSAYGPLRSAEGHKRHALHPFTCERWWPLVASLEDDAGRECGFLTSSPSSDEARPKPECAADAMYQLLDESGSFDLDRIAERLGGDRESVRLELRGIAYQLGPDGGWETAERYLCGDVVGKLDEARRGQV